LIYKIAVCDEEWNYVGTLTYQGEVFSTTDLEEAQDVVDELEEVESEEYQYHIISEELH
jgi:hypothetical protein